MVNASAFWRGRRVFVTGHTGFKGSWLCLWLQSLGAEVTGYALEPCTDPSLFTLANVGGGMNSIIGDIRSRNQLCQAVAESGAEIVFHLAAQPLVRLSYAEPAMTIETNVMGTVNLLEAVRGAALVKAVVVVTSDKCYENREWLWGYREGEAMGGYDPYSSSKGCAELITAAYRRSFFSLADYETHGVAIASARAGNVIGGGDWSADRLVPDILQALGEAKPVRIRNPGSIRPWQHVLEPLSGYLALAEALYRDGPAFAEGWNFAPAEADAQTVEWIVRQIADVWGQGAEWTIDQEPHPHEAHYLKLDSSKAHAYLDWHPRWPLDTALENIVAWHRHWLGGGDVRQMTLRQIAVYRQTVAASMNNRSTPKFQSHLQSETSHVA